MPALLISKLNACGLSESDDQEGGARADHRHEGGGKEDQDGCDDDCVLCFCISHFVQLFGVSSLFLVIVAPIYQLTSRKNLCSSSLFVSPQCI